MSNSTLGASPKSPHYFYTDPLAAGWMAKHFGMRLRPDCYSERALPIGEDITRFYHHAFKGKFYIHSDSMHLLEPRVGDLAIPLNQGSYLRAYTIMRVDTKEWRDLYFNGRMSCWDESNRMDEVKIIQRNGIPFHWPEFEAV